MSHITLLSTNLVTAREDQLQDSPLAAQAVARYEERRRMVKDFSLGLENASYETTMVMPIEAGTERARRYNSCFSKLRRCFLLCMEEDNGVLSGGSS